jgi:hypothetical protein
MAMVNVPRAKVAELLGLPADTDEETLRQALANASAAIDAQKHAEAVSAAEARACAEDRRIVIAAYNNSKMPANKIGFYQDAMSRDRKGIRALLASLASGLPRAENEKIPADAEVQAVHDLVMGRLGIKPTPTTTRWPTSRTVAAAGYEPTVTGGGATPPPAPAPILDDLGFPLPQVPRPILIKKGVNPSEYTAQQRSDAGMHALGQKFSAGVPRLPAPDQYFIPSPDDPDEFDAATGEFRPKPNNRAIPI